MLYILGLSICFFFYYFPNGFFNVVTFSCPFYSTRLGDVDNILSKAITIQQKIKIHQPDVSKQRHCFTLDSNIQDVLVFSTVHADCPRKVSTR